MKHEHLDSIEIYVQWILDLFGPAQRTTVAQNVSDLERPLEHDATKAVHCVSTLQELVENSPWVIEKAAAIVSRSSLSELLRYVETQPHFAVVARMAANALQQLRVTSASTA
jgi:2-oxo-4-hydroxy-4-carboxy--5-ureidoimidazoline (OHCU) decarboxylase